MKKYRPIFRIYLFVSLCPLVACAQNNQATYTNVPSFTPTYLATETDANSSSNEPTLSRLPTQTVFPTLSAEGDFDHLVEELFYTNGDCEFPCWWGIHPGKTEWQSIVGFLSSIQSQISSFRVDSGFIEYSVTFPVPKNIQSQELFALSFLVDSNGVISQIRVPTDWDTESIDYTLSSILQQFGVPEAVKISSSIQTPIGPVYSYVLFYQELGIMTLQTGEATLKQDTLEICPHEIPTPPKFWLWDPESNLRFEDIAKGQIIETSPAFEVVYVDLKELSELTMEDFYSTYRSTTSSRCILIDAIP